MYLLFPSPRAGGWVPFAHRPVTTDSRLNHWDEVVQLLRGQLQHWGYIPLSPAGSCVWLPHVEQQTCALLCRFFHGQQWSHSGLIQGLRSEVFSLRSERGFLIPRTTEQMSLGFYHGVASSLWPDRILPPTTASCPWVRGQVGVLSSLAGGFPAAQPWLFLSWDWVDSP